MDYAEIKFSNKIGALLGRLVPLQFLTNSKYFLDVISKGSRNYAKKMMLYVASTSENFRVSEISDIGFVRSEFNIVEGLKKMMSQSLLRDVSISGNILVLHVQLIIGKSLLPLVFVSHLLALMMYIVEVRNKARVLLLE